MQPRATRLLLAAGLAHLALAALLGVARAAGAHAGDPYAHAVVLAGGLGFLAAALALAVLPAFTRRDADLTFLAHAAVALAALGDLLWLGASLAGRAQPAMLAAPMGLSLLLLALAAPLSRLLGTRWSAGEPVLAPGQPFRSGDAVALFAAVLALVGLAATGALLLAPPRPVPTSALAAALLLAAQPAALAALVFLLPRESRAPLSGATLLGAAVLLQALAGAALAFAFARPVGADFRYPAAAVVAAHLLAGTALLRARVPEDAERPLAARPLLRAALALAVVAGLTLALALWGGFPNELLPLALYAHAALALALMAAALVAGSRLLTPAPPRAALAKWAAAAGTAGLFLFAPSLQHGRAAFPGSLALAAALLLLVLALAPALRAPVAAAGRRRGRRA